jgi:hypothetical protein
MAEGTDRVTEVDAKEPGDPQRIEADIVRRRGEIATLVAELSHRGHDLMDVRLQIRRHALGVAATVLAVGAVAAGSIALAVWRGRRRDTLTAQGGRLREAIGRMIDRPERVAVEPTVTQRVIGAAGSAAVAFLIKAVLERVNRPRQPTRLDTPVPEREPRPPLTPVPLRRSRETTATRG